MVQVKVKQSLYSLAGLRGVGGGGVDIPRFQDSRHMKVVRLSDLRICRRSAYSETTFRRLKSALNRLMMMMMMVVVVAAMVAMIIIITLTVVVVVSVFQSSRLTRIFLTQCAVLCLLRLQKLYFSHFICRFTFRAYNSMLIFSSVYGSQNKNK